MTDPRLLADTEAIIRMALHKFRAQRGERYIHVAGYGLNVHTAGERILHLPNGSVVKVTTCEADSVTHIEENDHLHAVVRPRAYPTTTRGVAAMNLTDEEIELILEWRDAQQAFVDAKKKKGYRDTSEYAAAAKRVDELRTKWRRIGEAVGTRTPVPPIKSGRS